MLADLTRSAVLRQTRPLASQQFFYMTLKRSVDDDQAREHGSLHKPAPRPCEKPYKMQLVKQTGSGRVRGYSVGVLEAQNVLKSNRPAELFRFFEESYGSRGMESFSHMTQLNGVIDGSANGGRP